MDIKKIREEFSQKLKSAVEAVKSFTMPKKGVTPQVPGAPEQKPASKGLKGILEKLKNFKFNRKNILIIAGVLIILAILVKTTSNIRNVLFKKKPAAAPTVSFEDEAIPVKVYKIKRIDFKDTLPAMGNIKGFKEIDLKFQVPGIIESFNFEEGEKVQEGDIVASLVQKEPLLKLKYSEIELNKNQKLYDLGAINQMKLDQTKLEYESAKSELDKTNIYAMSDGLLGTKLMDVGAYVTPNDKVGSFIQNDKVYAEFNIIEKDVPKVALGQKAEVFVDAYPNKSFLGTIDRIAPVIEGRSRTQNIKLEIDNKEGILKPGMFTRALIATYEKKEALVVPSSSLKKKEADYFVYVVHKEEPKEEAPEEDMQKAKESKGFLGIFKPKPKKSEAPKTELAEKPLEFGNIEIRKIKLGYMTQDLVEVDEGLKDDEMVVVEISEEFKDKARVEISEVQEGLF
ncbi:MAG: efflux RND transporter periplasmic adaptor subunit [Candidatus Omnitrophica bacterium]|nr:efflux RND transporter periplasmic adaptor subunit [Candidatus Omnitrophota bacterium]